VIKKAIQYIIKFRAHHDIIQTPHWVSRMLVVIEQRWDMVWPSILSQAMLKNLKIILT
jgi:hypothetical protein